MHVQIKAVSNSHGQAAIETTLILGVFVWTLIYSLKLALKFIFILSVDDFLESYLLCHANQPAAFCKMELQQKMNRVHINLDSIKLVEHPSKTVAHLQISNGLFETFQRSREYNKKY